CPRLQLTLRAAAGIIAIGRSPDSQAQTIKTPENLLIVARSRVHILWRQIRLLGMVPQVSQSPVFEEGATPGFFQFSPDIVFTILRPKVCIRWVHAFRNGNPSIAFRLPSQILSD